MPNSSIVSFLRIDPDDIAAYTEKMQEIAGTDDIILNLMVFYPCIANADIFNYNALTGTYDGPGRDDIGPFNSPDRWLGDGTILLLLGAHILDGEHQGKAFGHELEIPSLD